MASLKELMSAGVPVRLLGIGEYFLTQEICLVSTVLGSCVSVTFFHKPSAMAAIFHAMLPSKAMVKGYTTAEVGKFVDTAIPTILHAYEAAGVRPDQIETKLFGGAFTIEPERKGLVRDIVDVGAKNVEIAKRLLRTYGMALSKENILGANGRKIFFYTGSGEVWLKYLDKIERSQITTDSDLAEATFAAQDAGA